MLPSTLDQDLSGTYIFISFDLVNATAFKLKDHQWPLLFNRFFDFCRVKAKDYFPAIQNWKMVGDEILFYLPITSTEDLLKAPERAFSILQRCIIFLQEMQNGQIELSLKATMWIASTVEQRYFATEDAEDNYLVKTPIGDHVALDFLGPDIDTGFRISSYAKHGVLVLSADLAYLILENSPGSSTLPSKLRIVSLKLLKGVWSGRHYPIIWYHTKWDNPDAIFLYDDKLTSPLVEEIFSKKICENQNIQKIKKIYDDLHLHKKIADLNRGIERYRANNGTLPIHYTIHAERLSELHLVALCLNSRGEILVGWNIVEQLWDFGCSTLMMHQSVENSLKRGYKEDFGIDLQEISGEFPPVATYSFSKDGENRTVPGIMFLAKVDESKISPDPLKYDKIKWLTLLNSSDIEEEFAVPGFHDRLKRAFDTAKCIGCDR